MPVYPGALRMARQSSQSVRQSVDHRVDSLYISAPCKVGGSNYDSLAKKRYRESSQLRVSPLWLSLIPIVVKWTDAFSIVRIDANSPEHTPAFLKFAAILLLFEWTWFFIAWVGICKYGKV